MERNADGFDHSADSASLLESLLHSAGLEESDLCEADVLLLQQSAEQLGLHSLQELDSLVQEVTDMQLASQCAEASSRVPAPQSPSSLVTSLKAAVGQPGKVFAAQVIDAALSLNGSLALDGDSDPRLNLFYSKLMQDSELSQTLVSTLNSGIEDYEYEFIWTILQVKEQEVNKEVEEFRTRLSQQRASLQKLKPQLSNEWVAQLKQATYYKH